MTTWAVTSISPRTSTSLSHWPEFVQWIITGDERRASSFVWEVLQFPSRNPGINADAQFWGDLIELQTDSYTNHHGSAILHLENAQLYTHWTLYLVYLANTSLYRVLRWDRPLWQRFNHTQNSPSGTSNHVHSHLNHISTHLDPIN